MRTLFAAYCAAPAARAVVVLAALALGAAGCRDAGRSASGGDSTPIAPDIDAGRGADTAGALGGLANATHVVQLASLSDSVRATAMADSLAVEGWTARVDAAVVAGARLYRVQLVLAGGDALARHVAHALRSTGREVTVAPDSTRRLRAPRRTLYVVNRGTHGMAARVRWAFSPDRRMVLAVEDPTAVENDPLPNGFALTGPGGLAVQRDSVWDVAPSPDWTRLAYSRAYVSPPGERDSLTAAEWARLAARAGLEAGVVRRAAFPTSGMTYAVGVGRPYVLSVAGPSARTDTAARALPIAGGWRLRWSRDGAVLAVGTPPRRVADDADARGWTLVDPVTGAERGAASAESLAVVEWVAGPTLDISVPIDGAERRLVAAGGRTIRSREGWIRARGGLTDEGGTRRGARGTAGRGAIVGPGVALAVTADGSLVVALAPNPDARSYEATHHLVVYRIGQ